MFWAFPLYASFPLRYASWEYACKKLERYFTLVAGRKELGIKKRKLQPPPLPRYNEKMDQLMAPLTTQDRQA